MFLVFFFNSTLFKKIWTIVLADKTNPIDSQAAELLQDSIEQIAGAKIDCKREVPLTENDSGQEKEDKKNLTTEEEVFVPKPLCAPW